jgi:DNA-directed RNA polymerase subunit H (RpoH/RPB5)
MAHITSSVTKAFVTLKEMLQDRGVDVTRLEEYSEETLIDELTTTSNNSAIIDVVEGQLKVVICIHSKPAPNLKGFIGTSDPEADDGADTGGKPAAPRQQIIIVTKEPLQAAAIKKIHTGPEYRHAQVQFFTLKELQFNISRHHLVPEHKLVPEEEVADLMARYMVKTKGQGFSTILKTDPMARYINAQPGDLVRITRPSPSAGEYVSIRHCV